MWYSKVVMIMNITDYALISDAIKGLGVPGISISKVQGFGDYINDFRQEGLSDSLKIEIYTSSEQADDIASSLATLATSMTEGGGIVAIEPVSKIMNAKKITASEEHDNV